MSVSLIVYCEGTTYCDTKFSNTSTNMYGTFTSVDPGTVGMTHGCFGTGHITVRVLLEASVKNGGGNELLDTHLSGVMSPVTSMG